MTGPFGTGLPLVAAPMAGGASSLALIRAASAAGAFAFLPGGYKSAETLAAEVRGLKADGVRFGVNLFKVEPMGLDAADYAAYAAELQPEADPYGIDLSQIPAQEDDDDWEAKLAVLLADPVPWVSTTFGPPRPSEVDDLHAVGTRIAVTVTTVEEARETAGLLDVDLLVVQGSAAGGHSGTHDPRRPIIDVSTPELVAGVRQVAGQLPLIAGGGVDGRPAVREILDAGAQAVAVGTLLLRSEESGASATHQDALADPRFTQTVITHAFTGRPARGLRNGFIERHEAHVPYGYPQLHHLTSGLRKAAATAGDADRVHLWAGTGFRSARVAPVAEILRELAG